MSQDKINECPKCGNLLQKEGCIVCKMSQDKTKYREEAEGLLGFAGLKERGGWIPLEKAIEILAKVLEDKSDCEGDKGGSK